MAAPSKRKTSLLDFFGPSPAKQSVQPSPMEKKYINDNISPSDNACPSVSTDKDTTATESINISPTHTSIKTSSDADSGTLSTETSCADNTGSKN